MKLNRRIRRFGRSTRGLAALEFAILAPMMVLLLFGSVELIDVLGANRRVENTTASLADVVSRDTSVSDQEVEGLWDALDVLMFPDSIANIRIRVTSISIVDASTAQVVWSEGNGMAPLVAGSSVTVPAAMMRPGTSLIMAEAEYPYQSPLGVVLADALTLSHTTYRRSRLVDPIERTS